MRQKIEAFYYAFPVQLVFLHFRRNLTLIVVWILFLTITTQNFGRVFGVPYLFLDPEYLNHVGFWSFFIVGIAFGGMTAAFHITSYILYGHKYSFIGILEKPFLRFSLNNSLIPVTVFVIYLINITVFQLNNEFTDFADLTLMLAGLLAGVVAMLTLLYTYFAFTNKDIFKYLVGSVDKRLKQVKISRLNVMNKLKERRSRTDRIDSYWDLKLRVHSTKGLYDFYDKEAITKVFDQNHFNSVIIEIAAIGLIGLLGFFMDVPIFKIPAAASTLLIFTLLIMITGAISYWFRSWATTIIIILFLIINGLVKQGIINEQNHAFGLDYDAQPAPYSLAALAVQNAASTIEEDKANMLTMLQAWKSKQKAGAKPRAIILCMSGGGQRSALWTINVMDHLDSLLGGALMDQTVLMAGASGGLIGGAYYREVYRRKQMGEANLPEVSSMMTNIAMDNLNPIIFSLLVNDLFLRSQTFVYNEKSYIKDRGYAFEQQLNINTKAVLDIPLSTYAPYEKSAQVPALLMSPVIANDGRKLYISPHPVRFMNLQAGYETEDDFVGGIDFMTMFGNHGAADLRFLSGLRMSASFPYITPNVELPSEPAMQIMDAGISDNFGISDALKFLYTFKDWFAENTSGVVMISIRDTRKAAPIEPTKNPSIMQSFSAPISSVYNNLANIQDINNDSKIKYAQEWFKAPLSVVALEYNTYTNLQEELFTSERRKLEDKEMERASLSWHLTSREKANIINNILLPNNQRALQRIEGLIGQNAEVNIED